VRVVFTDKDAANSVVFAYLCERKFLPVRVIMRDWNCGHMCGFWKEIGSSREIGGIVLPFRISLFVCRFNL